MILLFVAMALMGLLLLAYVTRPLFARETASALPAQEDHDWQKETLMEAVRDLEYDFRLGKVSQQDYREQQQWLALEAARVQASARRPSSRTRICSACGNPVPPKDRFCGDCGAPSSGKKSTGGGRNS